MSTNLPKVFIDFDGGTAVVATTLQNPTAADVVQITITSAAMAVARGLNGASLAGA